MSCDCTENSEPIKTTVVLDNKAFFPNQTSFTTTLESICGADPVILSKTNGFMERYVNIENTGSCEITLFSQFGGSTIEDSSVVVQPGQTLISYISPQTADSVYFQCKSEGEPGSICILTFTVSI